MPQSQLINYILKCCTSAPKVQLSPRNWRCRAWLSWFGPYHSLRICLFIKNGPNSKYWTNINVSHKFMHSCLPQQNNASCEGDEASLLVLTHIKNKQEGVATDLIYIIHGIAVATGGRIFEKALSWFTPRECSGETKDMDSIIKHI